MFCDGVVEAEPRCGEDLFGAQLVPVHVGGSLEDLPRGQVHVEQDRVVVGGRPDSASAEHAGEGLGKSSEEIVSSCKMKTWSIAVPARPPVEVPPGEARREHWPPGAVRRGRR